MYEQISHCDYLIFIELFEKGPFKIVLGVCMCARHGLTQHEGKNIERFYNYYELHNKCTASFHKNMIFEVQFCPILV